MLSHHREHSASGKSSGNDEESDFAIAYTFLSLFLLVLSFFVVLTVLSEVVEERVEQALSSVAKVFSPSTIKSKEIFNPLKRRSAGFTKDFILEEIELLVDTGIHVARTKRNDRDGSLEVRVLNKALFQSDSAEIKPEMLILLQRISSTIANSAQPIYTSFVTGYDTRDTYIFSPPLSVRRAGELGRLALQEGISPDRVQSGLDTTLKGETVFQFQIGEESFPNVLYLPNIEDHPEALTETSPDNGVQVETGGQQQTPSQQTPSQQTPSQQTPSQQTPSQQTPSQQTPSQQTPSQQTQP